MANKPKELGNEKVKTIVVCAVLLVVGVLLLCVEDFKDFASLVFGIILILYAVYGLVVTLTAKTKKK